MIDAAGRKFTALLAVCCIGLLGYYYWAATRGPSESGLSAESKPEAAAVPRQEPEERRIPEEQASAPLDGQTASPEGAAVSASNLKTGPESVPAPSGAGIDAEGRRLLFRHTRPDANYGALTETFYPLLDRLKFIKGISCQALHFAAGTGVCLTADRGVFTKYGADLFDSSYNKLFHFDLQGVPSRCRMSPNGKLAAWTVFVTGHSYSSVDFSTRTTIADATSGEILADLEDFSTTKDGEAFHAVDFNFWGVTFTPDSEGFYCTLSSRGATYLVRGSMESRSFVVIRENVECPSLSPDGSTIAYKKRFVVEGRVQWRLHTLNLESMLDSPLAESRSVDDQLAWLDNRHVLYTLPENEMGSSAVTNVWVASIDQDEPPRLFLPAAYSPTVVR